MHNRVALVTGNNPFQMVREGVGLLGGIDSIVGLNQRVFLKPNLCTPKPWKTGATTDPLVVEAFIDLIKNRTRDISIIESDHGGLDAEQTFETLGYTELSRRFDIRLLNLSRGKLREIENPSGLFLKRIKIHEELLGQAIIVNFAVLKTNEVSNVSLSLKNMFGVLPNRIKARFHPVIDSVICDINKLIRPSLVILDGRIGMEGNGPTAGQPIEVGVMIFGTDPVAVDAIGARIMGLNPEDVPHVMLAEEMEIGVAHEITVIGKQIKEVQRRFRMPTSARSYGWKIRYGLQENRMTAPFASVAARILASYRKTKRASRVRARVRQ